MKDNSSLLSDESGMGIVSGNSYLKNMEDAQTSIFNRIIEPSQAFSSKQWISELQEYSLKYRKWLYSNITSRILMAEENDIENLNANLSTVSEELSLKGNKPRRKKDSLTEEQEHLFIKLFDHCNLAIAQRRIYRKTEEDLNQVINDAKDALTKNVKTATEKVNNIEKNLTGQLVGLISIFTALSFVVFGGMTILDSILDNIRTAPISRLICTGILWAICMSLLFMCFMKFILKIIHPERDPVFGNKFMIPYWIFIGVLSAILIVFVILSLRRPLFFTNI